MQKTTLNENIFEDARTICANEGIAGQGPPLDPRVNDLVFGWSTDSKVDKQQGQFFRINVDEKNCKNGFVLTCRGKNGCKFRMFLFDVDGNLLFQEEGMKVKGSGNKGNPQASMYFTNFDTYRLNNYDSPSDKTIPEVFCKLESYTPSRKSVRPGKYLLCIHGDNFYGKTYFNLLAVPAHDSIDCVEKIKAIDQELVRTKIQIDDAKIDFLEKKAIYEALLGKAKEDELKLNELVKVRDQAYTEFLDNSERPYRSETVASSDQAIHDIYPEDPVTIDAADAVLSSDQVEGGGGGDKPPPIHKRASALISGAFVAGAEKASGVASGVSASATAASGWLGGKIGQLRNYATSKLGPKKDGADVAESENYDTNDSSTVTSEQNSEGNILVMEQPPTITNIPSTNTSIDNSNNSINQAATTVTIASTEAPVIESITPAPASVDITTTTNVPTDKNLLDLDIGNSGTSGDDETATGAAAMGVDAVADVENGGENDGNGKRKNKKKGKK